MAIIRLIAASRRAAVSFALYSSLETFAIMSPSESIKFEFPAEIRQTLGDIVIAWSRVEGLIAELLTFLLKADPGSMYVLNQDIASSTQIKWIRVLAQQNFHPAALEQLNDLLSRLDVARGERNAYVHGLWGPGPTEGTAMVQTIKLDRTEVIKMELVTVSDLNELFSDIEAMSDELYANLNTLGAV